MIILKQGANNIILDNDSGEASNLDYILRFTTDVGDNNKEITITATKTNDRYIQLPIEIVTDALEDLNNGKVYLRAGLQKLRIESIDFTGIVRIIGETVDTLEYDKTETKYTYES